MINEQHNPDFSKTFLIDYFFEKQQHLRFEVMDKDTSSSDDLIGSVETTVSKLFGAYQ